MSTVFESTGTEIDHGDAQAGTLPELPAMRILKIAHCDSLSGRSELVYQIGCPDAASHNIHIRLYANSAKGYFCKDWVAMASMEILLSGASSFTSGDVQRLAYEGKSINSGGFLVSALRNEGLIRTCQGSLRSYEPVDSTAWQLEILALIESGVALPEHQAPVVVPVKATAKKSKAKPQAATTPMAA